uniref:Uncharacterized protein n=1 Tax=Arundo donax TaxID=35708 RepID=A0A0A9GJV4_ARUDO
MGFYVPNFTFPPFDFASTYLDVTLAFATLSSCALTLILSPLITS